MKVSFANKCEQKLSPIVSNNFCADSQFSLLTTLPLIVADVDFLIPMFTGKAKLQGVMQSFQNHFRAAEFTSRRIQGHLGHKPARRRIRHGCLSLHHPMEQNL
jgi:hypothetical protein